MKVDYDKLDAIRASDLDLIKSNPYFYYEGIRQELKSDVLDFGSLFHSMVLEPETVDEMYAVEPAFNKRTNAGKADYAQWKEDNKHKVIILQDDFNLAKKLADKAKKIMEFFEGEKEKIFTADYGTLKLKTKADFINRHILIDLKTISRVDINNDWELMRAIKQRKYHRQLAFYDLVLAKNGYEIKKYYLLFASKDTQWIRGVELPKYLINEGLMEAETILSDYENLVTNGFKIKNLFSTLEA